MEKYIPRHRPIMKDIEPVARECPGNISDLVNIIRRMNWEKEDLIALGTHGKIATARLEKMYNYAIVSRRLPQEVIDILSDEKYFVLEEIKEKLGTTHISYIKRVASWKVKELLNAEKAKEIIQKKDEILRKYKKSF